MISGSPYVSVLCMSVSISICLKYPCNCTKGAYYYLCPEPLTVPFTLVASGPESTTGESVTIRLLYVHVPLLSTINWHNYYIKQMHCIQPPQFKTSYLTSTKY